MSNKDQQDRYSVEDMVEAAHTKASLDRNPDKKRETREVVVQEDGTKVVKVRRRKRKAPENDELLGTEEDEKKFYLKLLLVSLATLLLLAAITAGIFFFKMAYYNNPDFVKNMEGTLSEKLESDVSIGGLRLGPTNSRIGKVEIVSSNLDLPYFKGQLNKVSLGHKPEKVILGGLAGGNSQAESASLVIDYHKKPEEKKAKKAENDFSIPFKHKGIEIAKTDIAFGSTPKSVKVAETKAKFLIRHDEKVQVYLRGGQLENVPNLPKFLDSGTIINEQEFLNIKTLKLSNGAVGNLELKGNFYKVTRLPQTLEANFNDLRLESLSAHLNDIIEARVSSEKGGLEIAPEAKEYKLNADIQVNNYGLSLKKFQFLETIGEKFGVLNYSYVKFLNAPDVSFQIDKDGYTFTNLNLEKQGSLALNGSFHVGNEGALSGQMKVGIPTAKILRDFPDTDRDSLQTSRGYSWFDIVLSGTTQAPVDDFAGKFEAIVDALQ